MTQSDVDAFRGVEVELLLQDAQDHDGGGHDGWLGVFGRGEGGVGAVGDNGAEGGREDVVHFFQEGFASFWECFKPRSSHADALDALACRESGYDFCGGRGRRSYRGRRGPFWDAKEVL